MIDRPFEVWVREVADYLNVEPSDVLALYQVKELLYESGASPAEAADFIRLNVGVG